MAINYTVQAEVVDISADNPPPSKNRGEGMSAIEILEKAAGHLKDRAVTYDKPEGERSIGATVAAFNIVTGDGRMNSEERGWLFMAILKMVRSQQGNYRADNYEDLAAYSALMGESACEGRNGGWTPKEIEAVAFKDTCKEYNLQEVIGDVVLSDWARWVAVDAAGWAREYANKPIAINNMWKTPEGGGYMLIRQVDPPINFKNCIWEIKNESRYRNCCTDIV